MVPYSNDFTSNLEALLKVIYYWETVPLRIWCNFVHIQATSSSHAALESANNANDVGHTNGDLHAANVPNNQGSDNNRDQASMW
jgi:hypothetical protein